MLTDEEVEALILHKLFMRKCWGSKHTSFENLSKGLKPKELGKEGFRRVNEIARKLIKEGLLLTKPTHYGIEVSLNVRENDIIMRKIMKFFED